MRNVHLVFAICFAATFFTLFSSCSKSGVGNVTPAPPAVKLSITALDVNKGPYGTVVKITGTGFSDTAINNHVYFNGKPASVIIANGKTLLTVNVPLAAGTGAVTI